MLGQPRTRKPIWILLAIDCQSLRIRAYAIWTGHSIRLWLSSAYIPRTSIGLLSNGCSATGPFPVKAEKMFMLGIASLLLFVSLFFLLLFLCLSLSCLKSYPFMELKCTEERFYLVRVVRDINVHIQYNTA